jgi:hypothetical protein
MELLSEDDLNLKDMTPEELDRAWDLWFDLAQTTNDSDPLYTHGVFVLYERSDLQAQPSEAVAKLVEEGLVEWQGGKPKGLRGITVRGEPVSETIIRDRR